MNLLVVGVSHHTASVELLERLTVSREQTPRLLRRLVSSPYIGEAVVVSTCNRVEVYAAVNGFHGGLAEIGFLDREDSVMCNSVFAEDESADEMARYQLATMRDHIASHSAKDSK